MADILIVSVYILATIVVGYIYGRNVKSMRDFSVAGKTYPTAAIVSSIFATWMGGDDLIGVTERIYSVGIIFLIVMLTQFITLLIHAYFIAPKMLEDFEDKVSIGEIMGTLYGKYGRIIAGIATIMISFGYIAAQVSCLGYICTLIPGVSHSTGTIIGSLIVISYSSFGGIRSVVSTDVLQFGILIIAIPVMANVALFNIGGLESLLSRVDPSYFTVGPSRPDFWYHVGMCFVCAFPFFNPTLTQRILMSKDARQASNSLIIAGSLYVPFYIAIAIIGLCAIVLFPNIQDPNIAFINILSHSLPTVVKGLAIAGFLAVVMSTTDSHLNVASVSIVRDITVVLCPNLKDRTQLRIARISTIFLGLFAILVSTSFTRLIDFFVYFSNFWMPTVVAPMVLYMFDIRINTLHYILSMVIGFIAIWLLRSINCEALSVVSQLFGMSVTIICMLIFHQMGSVGMAFQKKKSEKKVIIYGD